MTVPATGVILAGGGGTRLWPLVGPERPKPLLPWGGGGRSLLRSALERACPPLSPEQLRVVGVASLLERLRGEIPELAERQLWPEPAARNTGPALLLAAHRLRRESGDGLMVVLPADHRVADETAFRDALGAGLEEAAAGALVTLGVVPDRPATGYGYLEQGKGAARTEGALPVRRFVEKPDAAAAKRYLSSRRFLWNAGIFVWRTEVFLDAYRAHAPDVAAAAETAAAALLDGDPGGTELWSRVPAGSVDYQLMEKAEGVSTVPLRAGWDDLGDWDAVRRMMAADELRDAVVAEAALVDSEGAMALCFQAESMPVAVVGCPRTLVLRGPQGLLVLGPSSSGAVKAVPGLLTGGGGKD